MTTTSNVIGIVSAGAMGSAIAGQIVKAGLPVLTWLDGRSDATRERARNAGIQEVSLPDLVSRSTFILSILPPSDAFTFAESVAACENANPSLRFVDCNAVNPETVKRIAQLFPKGFVDAAIIGGPPDGLSYNPTVYASADDQSDLDAFVGLKEFGLSISALRGDGGAGQASALKMSYAGISKGMTGLFTAMILAAHEASPATAEALIHELSLSQPFVLQRITKAIPSMIPKAYRWVGEMNEIAQFQSTNAEEGKVYQGMAKVYERVEKSVANGGKGDVEILKNFVKQANEKINSSQ